MSKYRHIFLSYLHENEAEVARLRDDLISAGEKVWWDKDIKPGHDWKFEIRQALRESYAVLLCLSEEVERRSESGIFPEALDAIEIYRQYSPGKIFLIPVRLSECTIPHLEIDATRTLDRLQYVDLFPEHKRAAGLERLVAAVRSAPNHP